MTPDVARGIPRRAHDAPAPLSAAQQRFWMFERFWPGTAVYNRPLALRLRGPLRLEALRAAIGDVVARHEALRTVFTDVDGEARQEARPPDSRASRLEGSTARHAAIADPQSSGPSASSLREVDLSDIAPGQRASALDQAIEREAVEPFDLSASPMRALLIRAASDEHVLVITVHHIVFDGWSAGILFRELAQCYDARCEGREPDLPGLPIQLADHAAWQSERLSPERVAASIDYWRAALDGAPDALALPTDHPRPARRSFRGGRRSVDLSQGTTAALGQVARQSRATPFMVLLAAYAAMLHRYTGDADIVIGCPIAGRTHVELEPVIGCFINTLPIRVMVDGDRPFADLIEQSRRVALEAFAHQDLPLQTLVETLRPGRHANRPPLFQAMFNFRNLPPHEVSMAGLQVEQSYVETGTALVDLSLEIARIASGMRISFEYDADLFEGETVERMLRHFVTLLEAALEHPVATVDELPLLSPDAITEMLALGDGGQSPLPEGQGVHDLIAARAAAAGNEIAVEGEGERLTYSELLDRSQRIADALAARGVASGALVGVALERSVDLIVTLLGVWRAGAAYLPLDPEYPEARLRFMISDAACAVILTRRRDAERFAGSQGTVLVVEDLLDSPNAPRTPVQPERPDSVAYVMYTSGSTGTPKGVPVLHRGLTNHNLAVIAAFGLTPRDRVLQFASPSFDGSVEEIVPTLIAGATLVLRGPSSHVSARAFLDEIGRLGITVLNLPTAFWQEWVASLPADSRLPQSLRLVIVGGEQATVDAYRRWQALAGHRVPWLNTYGPTEATIVATIWDPERQPVAPDPPVLPIGRPLPNVRAYVLDGRTRPVPVGVPGELWIGGAGVAAGYLNRPDLTAERFVPDPFSSTPGARLYRTGDRARWRSDGLLEFLGRVDGQLKIRGYRVEPGEIEAALREQPGVRDAAVVVRRGDAGDARLVAFVAAERAGAELQVALADRLPSYMRPDAIVRLGALPRDGSGKTDRRALEQMAYEPIAAPAGAEAPRTEAERRLLEIWRDVLGVRDLGVHDEFFASGGHSLLALRLTSRIEAEFGVQLAPTALFEHPTVAQLATRLVTGGRASVLVPIQPGGARLPLFCVHEFFGDVLVYGQLAAALGPDQPLYGLRAPGLDGDDAPLRDVPSLASRYIAAMRERQPAGPYALAGLCAGGVIAFEMAQQLMAAGERVALLALLDSNARSPGTPASVADGSGTADVLGGIVDWAAGASDLTPPQWRALLRLKRRLIGGRLARALGRGNGAGTAYRVDALATALRLSDRHRRVGMALREGLQRYVPRSYAGPAVLFRPRMQPRFGVGDRSRGWSALVTGGLTICSVPGNHLAMLQEPHVRVLARELATRLGDGARHGGAQGTLAHAVR